MALQVLLKGVGCNLKETYRPDWLGWRQFRIRPRRTSWFCCVAVFVIVEPRGQMAPQALLERAGIVEGGEQQRSFGFQLPPKVENLLELRPGIGQPRMINRLKKKRRPVSSGSSIFEQLHRKLELLLRP